MRSNIILVSIAAVFFLQSCKEKNQAINPATYIASGQMPNITKDNSGGLHLVYGNEDSILYSFSTDDGISFSRPALISVLPQLAASHMRGPQIAATRANGKTRPTLPYSAFRWTTTAGRVGQSPGSRAQSALAGRTLWFSGRSGPSRTQALAKAAPR